MTITCPLTTLESGETVQFIPKLMQPGQKWLISGLPANLRIPDGVRRYYCTEPGSIFMQNLRNEAAQNKKRGGGGRGGLVFPKVHNCNVSYIRKTKFPISGVRNPMVERGFMISNICSWKRVHYSENVCNSEHQKASVFGRFIIPINDTLLYLIFGITNPISFFGYMNFLNYKPSERTTPKNNAGAEKMHSRQFICIWQNLWIALLTWRGILLPKMSFIQYHYNFIFTNRGCRDNNRG